MAVRMYDLEYDGTVEKLELGGRRGQNRERTGETYRLRHRLRHSSKMGLAGADHDGGDVCSCSRNDSV